MISQNEKKLLLDILNCIESIDEHLQYQRNLQVYLNNKTQRRAVERELEIIGEAISNLLK
ncbi:MAG: HepT-like ribonuclease domain-containing protein, partial [Pelobium sp.]